MSVTDAAGERSIAVGGDVIQSILVTGDHNRVFVGDYQRLADAYIPPGPVFDRVRLDRFTGREWLVQKVDAFLAAHDRGVFVLEADAGLGKTAFLAHLAKERGYVSHFVELARGPDGVAPGLRNLAAQIVGDWQLNPYAVDGVLVGPSGRPEFLQKLLKEAADRRDEVRPDKQIVLVVDALDESGTPPPGQNVLGLPRVLPKGVYLIVSQRPVDVPLVVEAPARRVVERLQAQDDANLVDMRQFLEGAATRPGTARELAAGGYGAEQFVTTLLEKCRGVWVYLHFVLLEIEAGRRSPLKLDDLPEGLWQYYAEFWKGWQRVHDAEWDDLHLPLLSTLAAVEESVELEFLCILAGVAEHPRIGRLLQTQWRPYLAAAESPAGRTYRLYHASLRDFFTHHFDPTDLNESDRVFTEALAEATRRAHGRITDHYLTRWGGWEAGLPALRAGTVTAEVERYGLRHLAGHLEGAGREDQVHELLRLEWREDFDPPPPPDTLLKRLKRWWSPREPAVAPPARVRRQNVWFAAHDRADDLDSYLADVARAWRLAEHALDRGDAPRALGLQCRYALVTASLNSLATNIPSALLTALVVHRAWPAAKALALARQVPHAAQRAEALTGLAPHLNGAERATALREALAAALGIWGDMWARATALTGPAPHLEGAERATALREALAAAWGIEDKEYLATTLTGLAPHLDGALLGEALASARGIRDEEYRATALTGLAPHLDGALLGEALVSARGIEREEYLTTALTGLAPHLDGAERATALREALAAARGIGDEQARARALTGLAPHLEGAERVTALREALAAARGIGDEAHRAKFLTGLAPHLEGALLGEALAAARGIGDEWARARALTGLAPHLEGALLGEALAAARGIGDEKSHATALTGLAPHLEGAERATALREALAASRSIRYEEFHATALTDLVPHLALLSPESVTRVWTETLHHLALKRRSDMLGDLTALGPVLLALGGAPAVQEMARAIIDVGDWWP